MEDSVSIRHLDNENKHKVKNSRKQKYNYRYIIVIKTDENYILNHELREFIADSLVEVNESLENIDIDDIAVERNCFKIIITHYEPNKALSIAVNKIKTLLGRKINKKYLQEVIEDGESVEYLVFDDFKVEKGKLWRVKDYFSITFNEKDFIAKSIQAYLNE